MRLFGSPRRGRRSPVGPGVPGTPPAVVPGGADDTRSSRAVNGFIDLELRVATIRRRRRRRPRPWPGTSRRPTGDGDDEAQSAHGSHLQATRVGGPARWSSLPSAGRAMVRLRIVVESNISQQSFRPLAAGPPRLRPECAPRARTASSATSGASRPDPGGLRRPAHARVRLGRGARARRAVDPRPRGHARAGRDPALDILRANRGADGRPELTGSYDLRHGSHRDQEAPSRRRRPA